ncbi:MAG: S41 family peptidase [Rikenellaceae bacterium]|nr:S41 family peptidase [Rikenellaceae bacterium]
MNRRKRVFVITLVSGVALLLMGFTSVAVRDGRLGRNIEILVSMLRDLSLYYVDEVDSDKLLRDAAKGMVSSLDPYTELITHDRMSELDLMTTGKYGGIGALIRADSDYVRIAEPYRDCPADRAGLKIGDAIVAIDGEDMRGRSTQEVSTKLKGDPGTTLHLTVRRVADGTMEKINIRRERISIPAVKYYGMVADSIGYILHCDFTDGSSAMVRKAVEQLMSEGAKSLILDYRENGGGVVQEAIKIVSLFVPAQTEIVTMRGRGGEVKTVLKTEDEPIALTVPLAVLVDGNTASSSEILAGAIQDLDRGVIIGERTFGKGLVQSTMPLEYDNYLKFTTSKYYTPSGRCIQSFDYHNQERDRSKATDSLVSEFKTAGGRKVYDGGGIAPDVAITPKEISNYAAMVYAAGLVDDFADEYFRTHEISADSVENFAITTADFDRFVAMVGDRTFDYDRQTHDIVLALAEAVEAEGYGEKLTNDIKNIASRLVEDRNNATMLRNNQELITDLIEEAIVLRAAYNDGVVRYRIADDKCVEKAVELLTDSEAYNKILSPDAQ